MVLRHVRAVRIRSRFFAAIFLWCTTLCAPGAHTQVELLLSAKTARPGDTVIGAVHLHMDPQWHTYWKNPGASGAPTEIAWKLPPGVLAGELQWPAPRKLPDKDLTTYIYEGDTALIVRFTLAKDLKPGPIELKGDVSWLECSTLCVPGKGSVKGQLVVGSGTELSDQAQRIADWAKKLPAPAGSLAVSAWWDGPAQTNERSLSVEWPSTNSAVPAEFYPGVYDNLDFGGDTERITSEPGKGMLRKSVKKYTGDWPKEITGVVAQGINNEVLCCEIKAPIGDSRAGAATTVTPSNSASPPAARPLWVMLLYAFLGGMILNLMPCVLPVIALKILGFVSQSRDHPGRVRQLGLIYGAGVLVSFLVLAGLVVGVKAAGHRAGWGMQFSNPQFLVLMVVLVTLVALNLFGLFEVTLSGSAAGAAGELAARHGSAGAFFNGVLATALATPCTAPFLSIALGFAFTQTTPLIFLMFITVGCGLAFPYVVLSCQPAWLKFLPRPGAWMEKFKVAMGFPMLATAVWLFSLLPVHYGDRAWWVGIFLVIVAFAAWAYGQLQRGGASAPVVAAVPLLVLAAGYFFVLEVKLEWRSPMVATSEAGPKRHEDLGAGWLPWSATAVAEARSAGHPVIVDFTADWCLTCNTVVKPALKSERVKQRVRELNAVTLVGDYTLSPDNITSELYRYGRAGVPLVLVFPSAAARAAIVLPEVLTSDTVVNALNEATK